MSTPPPPRGRGAAANPPNRFEQLHIEPDVEAVDDGEPRKVETRFLRDTSKSILAANDSPDIGFRYSINPYRGCEHGCSYCMDGDTLILMADGSQKRLADVRTGDLLIGTRRHGHYRRFVRNTVLDHWQTEKPAFRIELQDGTELIASGDHRFLTERGWKHVTGAQQGIQRRPHLTTNNSLLGTGAIPKSPIATPMYRQGYLCGMIRGDGHLARYHYARAGRAHGNQFQFRLALSDGEALERSRAFLEEAGIESRTFLFSPGGQNRRPVQGIRTHAAGNVAKIFELVEIPGERDTEWWRGFAAGLFDAEGSFSRCIVRVANSDGRLLKLFGEALDHLGFDWTLETRPERPMHYVRITGGLARQLAFLSRVDSAIVRKRSIEGRALKTSASLRVRTIEPVGARGLYDITTETGDFIANGVVSHNCYARPSHEYLGFSAGLDFETRILVKENAPELLEAAFQKKSWEPQVVILSGNTDPYQPAERKLEVSRRCLEVFLRHRNPVGIITKNYLVTRDLDILAQLAEFDCVAVQLSITSLRDEITNVMEPRTSRAARRLDAIRKLSAAGIPVGVMVAPIIPGLTDEEVPAILEAAAEAGATRAGYTVVRLNGSVEPVFAEWIQRAFPDRAQKVLNRIRDVHRGQLNDSRFGKRQRGDGIWAETIGKMFRTNCERLGLNAHRHELSTAHFKRLRGGQMDMF
jgi:DNA repair photolyase